jgi:tetratricopeptide (TPR) repeat protein
MADVFISYASEDRERVRALAAALAARGLSVWWDRAASTGEDYAAAISKAVDDAKAIVVVWSRLSVDSPWVREEAARARKTRRLAPILLDHVEAPHGFGGAKPEDFTVWSGQADAPEVERLAEMLKRRVAGGATGRFAFIGGLGSGGRMTMAALAGAVVASIAIVAAAIIVIDRGERSDRLQISAQHDLSRLVDLARQGKLTGNQAVELSALLQRQAFVDVAPAAAGAAPDQAESAKATFSDAAAQLFQDPDAQVRAAAVAAADPAARRAGMDQLWALAALGRASSATIYRYCGAIGALTHDPRTRTALERARAANPQDRRLWRLLSYDYRQANDVAAAQAAALVSEGLAAAAAGRNEQAAGTLEQALSQLSQANARAFVLGQLGDIAARRDDWDAAERRYRAAVDIHADARDVAGVAIDAAKLARAQVQLGDAQKACATLERALRLGAETVAGQARQVCPPDRKPRSLQR